MPPVEESTISFIKRWNSTDGPKDFSLQSYRTAIADLVDAFLKNLNEAAESLASTGEDSGSYRSLTVCLAFHRENPDIFIQTSDQTGTSSVETENIDPIPSIDFCFWFFRCLLRLLSRPDCKDLHPMTIKLMTHIMHATKLKNRFVFKHQLVNFITLCTELVEVSDQLENGIEGNTLNSFNFSLNLARQALKDSSLPTDDWSLNESKVQTVELSLDDSTHCQLLQVNLVKILGLILVDVYMFCKRECYLVWAFLCDNLEKGNVGLKLTALEVLTGWLRLTGPPPLAVSDYFHGCLLGLIEMLCSGDSELSNREQADLELSLSKLIVVVVEEKTFVQTGSPLSVFRQVSNQVTVEGLHQLTNPEARQAVTSLFVHLLKAIPSADLKGQVYEMTLRKFVIEVMNLIGTEDSTDLILPMLVELLQIDVNTTVTDQTCIRLKRYDSYMAAANFPILNLLTKKLNAFSSNQGIEYLILSQAPSSQELECVYVVMTVVTQILLHQQDLPDSFYLVMCSDHMINSSLDAWIRYFNGVCSGQVESGQLKTCYQKIVKSIAFLLLVNNIRPLHASVLQQFSWIVTLPWIPGDMSWKDMKPTKPKEVANIASKLSQSFDVQVMCLCIKAMALLPREIAGTWRAHILTQAMSDSDEEVMRTAVKFFPICLLHMGNKSNHLVQELLYPLLDMPSKMHLTIAKHLGSIFITLAQSACMVWSKVQGPKYSLDDIDVTLKNTKKERKDKGLMIDSSQVLPFLSLLKCTDNETRLYLVESLSFVFDVMDIDSQSAVSIIQSCLDLLLDENEDVRTGCCCLLDHILETAQEGSASLVWTRLKTIADQCSQQYLPQVILAIGQFGRLVEGELLESAVISLLKLRFNPSMSVAAVALEQLQRIANDKKESMQLIYARFKPAIYKFVVEAITADEQTTGGMNAKTILVDVAKTFESENLKAFIQTGEKYMLPLLVQRASPEATKVIKLLAGQLSSSTSYHALLMDNTKYIFSFIVRSCQKEEMEKALLYLQDKTEFSLGNLLRLDFQRVHNELLVHLSTHYQQVFNGLKTVASHDDQYKGSKSIQTPEQMAQYLEPRLLGVLAFFDSQLINSNITLEDKKLALRSLISIIQLMGSRHIGSIRYKVMNTLRLGLKYTDPGFVEISCKAWSCFVHSLELSLLGGMMSQIIATLLPLLQVLPVQVAEIFNYLIVENRVALGQHFHEIYFLPDIKELSAVHAVLRQRGEHSASSEDLKTTLTHSINGIHHESLDVRAHALSKLRKILRDKRKELSSFVLNSETAEPLLSQLVSALLIGCRETDSHTQLLYGQCLGELGAIDPGRLDLISQHPESKSLQFCASIVEDKFAFGLINIVVKAFLAATEPRIQDCAAFALQELLNIYKIHQSGTNKLWTSFTEDMQEILIPLLSSKYKLDIRSINYPRPIYGSEKGKNFKDWISNWTGYLITKINPGTAKQVFTACSAVKRHSKQVALYILPHVVLQVLTDGTRGNVDEIYRELMEVLCAMQKPESIQDSSTNFQHLSAQTIFSIMDYLTMWLNHQVQACSGGRMAARETYESNPCYAAVKGFLKRIPQDVLAEACLNCKAYTRALRHFEMFVSADQDIQKHLDFMQKLYVLMDEPDGVLGISAVRVSQPTLMQQILTHEALGELQDAQACYDRAIELEPDVISHHHGILKSLMDLAQPGSALFRATGILAERPSWTQELNSYCIEAAWKLSSWDKLEQVLKCEKGGNNNWAVLTGKILMASKVKKESEFLECLELARKDQMGPLSAASMEMGSYSRAYENILRLHMINEIEEFFQVLVDFPHNIDDHRDVIVLPSASDLLEQWHQRLQMTQSSFRTQEPILTLRRTLLSLIQKDRHPGLERQIGKWWLWSAKVARKAGYLQSAYGCLIQASSYNLPEFYVEKAKWLYEKGESVSAIACLDKGIQEHFGTDLGKIDTLNQPLKQVYAQAMLLYARYSEETSNLETNSIVKSYKNVIAACPEWEDGYFHLAKYYDRVMNTIIDDKDKAEKQGDFIIYVVRNFGHSLQYGNQHIYQSLPRLLSLWLDYGTVVVEAERRDKGKQTQKLKNQRTVLKRINDIICELNQELSPYQMFTAFAQLISRICHAQPDVFIVLKEIISRLLIEYPHQAIWMMMAVSKSSYKRRAERCTDIFATAVQKRPGLSKLIQDYIRLTDHLIEVCEKHLDPGSTSLNVTFRPLKRLFEDRNLSQMLLPTQASVCVKLPATIARDQQHSPFPDNPIYIQGFEDNIEVLPSLQRPKKITILGSDGQRYVMMCKPRDDLRKDCRLMDFNNVVNRFLRRDPESRRRGLLIRTYNVTPLNKECGLIEWVNNTTGLRHVLLKLYKQRGIFMTGKELTALKPPLNASIETKMKIFKEKLLPKHPPLFPEWFLRTFPDPTSWYSARVSYARTAAVMSMVGYILGLGDRHGENILFDSTTGDCIHVDFNCLFNKGETFEWPERVPFRLTHNMTAAFGPLGYEGVFRRACEMTLKVIRDQMDPLMSVLKPFIYDPLVEWSTQSSRGQHSSETGEINNELALSHVQNIEDRMRGILKTKAKPRCLPLSIEGHVDYLIKEATDETNLCAMYIGWAAFM
ncbi:serine/threonine-protein kinase ATR-like isoform X2 [Physella acuta]|uniref:serine/threonine-protein kinase ATR-like isoform X2 n=1 Tax=Physella acuta TaxID=109671 RepID=UPI0027DAC27B|nr:serine/threonine-protein kinase ATR-like isoform X2 [Physella acuta]